jgi:putative phosphoribosyl transferase
MMIFKNRQEAGQKLAEALKDYKNERGTIVLALPRGGVVIGFEIAKALGLPLDIIVSRKIGAPENPEYALGALAETGEVILNEEETKYLNQDWLKKEIEKEKQEAQRRLNLYRPGSPLKIKNKTVILVDDGLATGYTLEAAVASIKVRQPKEIIVAIPHGARDSIERIKKKVDKVICLYSPLVYWAVGAHYQEFPQVSDQEVIKLLEMAKEINKSKGRQGKID